MGGAFLSPPVTSKKTNKYQHDKIRVVACEMQGRRKYMEDAILLHCLSKQTFLFGVFDGHGVLTSCCTLGAYKPATWQLGVVTQGVLQMQKYQLQQMELILSSFALMLFSRSLVVEPSSSWLQSAKGVLRQLSGCSRNSTRSSSRFI